MMRWISVHQVFSQIAVAALCPKRFCLCYCSDVPSIDTHWRVSVASIPLVRTSLVLAPSHPAVVPDHSALTLVPWWLSGCQLCTLPSSQSSPNHSGCHLILYSHFPESKTSNFHIFPEYIQVWAVVHEDLPFSLDESLRKGGILCISEKSGQVSSEVLQRFLYCVRTIARIWRSVVIQSNEVKCVSNKLRFIAAAEVNGWATGHCTSSDL